MIPAKPRTHRSISSGTSLPLACLAALLAGCGGEGGPGPGGVAVSGARGGRPAPFTARVSTLKEGPEFLGPGWLGPTGLVVDDLDDLSSLAPPERKAAGPIVSARPAGLEGCADFTYRREDDLLKIVTLRIFVFDSPASALGWWTAKYEGPGWETHYRKVPGTGDRAVDSTEIPKRIVLASNVVLTCHQPEAGDEHRKVLGRYLEKVGYR